MGIFLKVLKAKFLSFGMIKNQKGVALLEYLLLAGGVLAAVVGLTGSVTAFFTEVGDEFDELTSVVDSVVP